MTLILTRLSLDTHKSRSRIRSLEKDESARDRLVHIIGQLEHEMESVVVDMLDNPGVVESTTPMPLPDHPGEGEITRVTLTGSAAQQEHCKQEVVLSEIQRKIVASLNTLPELKKELAFIHPVLNSHAVIIVREAHRFAWQKQGEGVIRHWVDHFIM